MSVKVVLVAACALIDADGRVLIAQRPEGKSMAGLWEFPGGKVDPGERPEDALIRELKEELGIVVNEACLAPLTFASHTYEDFHLLMPLYVCRRWEGMVTPRENQKLAWVRPNKLQRLSDAAGGRAVDLTPDDAAVMPMKAKMESTTARTSLVSAAEPARCRQRGRRHRDRIRADRRGHRRHRGRDRLQPRHHHRQLVPERREPVLALRLLARRLLLRSQCIRQSLAAPSRA